MNLKTLQMFCLAALTALLSISPVQARSDSVKAMWVWDFYVSVHASERREELIRFSLRNDINVLFVGTRRTLPKHQPEYAALIELAHRSGIRVFALAGEAAWALKENHPAALEHIREVSDFNSRYPATAFDGVQLDIEPYTLPEFSQDMDAIGSQMLHLLQDVDRIFPAELELNAAIPFWYAGGVEPKIVAFDGASKPLSHHILDLVDSVSIMAYRDRADRQIQVSANDIEYAGRVGKTAYVGAETLPPDGERIPERITYYGKKTGYMNVQLEAIRAHYADNPGFGGIAVHSYDSYREMLRQEEELMKRQFAELKDAGLITGYPGGDAGFGKASTRAEVATTVARLGGYTQDTLHHPETPSFRDVTKADWHYGWVESALEMEVMEGRGLQRFDPYSLITVEEAIIALAKTIGVEEARGAAVTGASEWAQGWVQAMIEEGVIEPRNSYTYAITREDLIDIVYRSRAKLK